MHNNPSYVRVFATFLRNSLVRDMTFRSNFIIESISSLAWVFMNLGFYTLIFMHADEIGKGTGWGQYEFFVFLATTMFVNSLVQAFFMPNAEEFSELIRTGNLDFALLKPIDTQFLISFNKMNWSQLSTFATGLGLLVFSLWKLSTRPVNALSFSPVSVILYPFFILCGLLILYSLMITLAASSVWLGRNQSLYNFWFYITNFSRYPMEIYGGPYGAPLRHFFTFIIPVLVVVNVPARILTRPIRPEQLWEWQLSLFALFATLLSLLFSRWVFTRSLLSYRSASS